ncbi:hypothetical protein AMECASPLE_024359 [Ameca splendens]|uniref:Uncharacterized protein n=1 Tax=Ameca splendens TaxID=208324 RepID=A0ABV0ZS03_9TELE
MEAGPPRFNSLAFIACQWILLFDMPSLLHANHSAHVPCPVIVSLPLYLLNVYAHYAALLLYKPHLFFFLFRLSVIVLCLILFLHACSMSIFLPGSVTLLHDSFILQFLL